MDCKIIKDLIPLSEEGLCSEESAAMIEEHIKDCKNCRMLYEKIPVDKKSAPVPDEQETFKKVNRKMKKLTWKSGICGLLLLAILGVLGYLTFGQITKMDGLHSFETIIQSLEVRKMAKYIADKDFDSLVKEQGHSFDEYIFLMYNGFFDEVEEIDKKILKETYEKDYGNTKVKNISVKSCYVQVSTEETYMIPNAVTYEYEDGRTLEVIFIKESDGLYKLYLPSYESADINSEFKAALGYFSYHTNYLTFDKSAENYYEEDYFNKEYYDEYIESRKNFNEAGFETDNIIQGERRFDKEKNMLYYDITIEASDDKGSAILTTRLYYDYLGFIPPERDTINVYTDNCTPELEEALYNFFG